MSLFEDLPPGYLIFPMYNLILNAYASTPACPIQIEGTINDWPFYFRERHNCWRMTVVKPGEDPVVAGRFPDEPIPYLCKTGEGSLGFKEAMSIVAITAIEVVEKRYMQSEGKDCSDYIKER